MRNFYQAVIVTLFQHTAARRRLIWLSIKWLRTVKFQHTAARRRLLSKSDKWQRVVLVSTHSRPKAAERFTLYAYRH